MAKFGSPTGTVYARLRRVSDDAIIGTFGSAAASTLPATGAPAFVTFSSTPVTNPSVQDARFTLEYDDGDASNCVRCYYSNYSTITGVRTHYTSPTWTDAGSDERVISIRYDGVGLTNTGTSAGEHQFSVVADGADATLYVDGVSGDTESLNGASVADNANAWNFTKDGVMPYVESINITVGGTTEVLYDFVRISDKSCFF